MVDMYNQFVSQPNLLHTDGVHPISGVQVLIDNFRNILQNTNIEIADCEISIRRRPGKLTPNP